MTFVNGSTRIMNYINLGGAIEYAESLEFTKNHEKELFHDLPCHCALRGSNGRSEIDIHLRGAHAAEKVAVVGRDDHFVVRQNAACPAAAEAAAGRCDHGACLCERGERSVRQRFPVDLAAGRRDDQLDERRHLLSFQNGSCCLQVFETPVGAGADEDLVDADAAVNDLANAGNDASFFHFSCA